MKLARKGEDGTGSDKAPTKQLKLMFTRPEKLQPQDVRRLDAEYIVEDILPLATVESPTFRKKLLPRSLLSVLATTR